MTEPAPASTRDVVFLAVTRPAMAYGVPIGAYVLAVGAGTFSFVLAHRYNVWWRLGICGGAMVAVLGGMRVLTSWEPRWFQILTMWWKTTAPARLSRATRVMGGSTLRPWPVAIRQNIDEMRDYAG